MGNFASYFLVISEFSWKWKFSIRLSILFLNFNVVFSHGDQHIPPCPESWSIIIMDSSRIRIHRNNFRVLDDVQYKIIYSRHTLSDTFFWRWKVVSLRENVSLRVCQWDFVTYPEWHISSKIVSLRENLMQFFPKWHTFPPKHVYIYTCTNL